MRSLRSRTPEPRRCWWANSDPLLRAYHDREWGRPVRADRRLFEKLALEGFQAGLSWRTILAKRTAFRRAFYDFEPARVARFGRRDVTRLLGDAGIVRHRGKIEAAIQNARGVLAIAAEHGSFARWVWSFAPAPSRPPRNRHAVPAVSEQSRALAGALKEHGFRFVGPTTVYAFMQAMGLVNDHVAGCAFGADPPRRGRARRAPAPHRRPPRSTAGSGTAGRRPR